MPLDFDQSIDNDQNPFLQHSNPTHNDQQNTPQHNTPINTHTNSSLNLTDTNNEFDNTNELDDMNINTHLEPISTKIEQTDLQLSHTTSRSSKKSYVPPIPSNEYSPSTTTHTNNTIIKNVTSHNNTPLNTTNINQYIDTSHLDQITTFNITNNDDFGSEIDDFQGNFDSLESDVDDFTLNTINNDTKPLNSYSQQQFEQEQYVMNSTHQHHSQLKSIQPSSLNIDTNNTLPILTTHTPTHSTHSKHSKHSHETLSINNSHYNYQTDDEGTDCDYDLRHIDDHDYNYDDDNDDEMIQLYHDDKHHSRSHKNNKVDNINGEQSKCTWSCFFRYFILITICITIGVTLWVYFRKLQALVHKIMRHRIGGYFLLIASFVLQSLLCLPTLPLTLAGGYTYGVSLGTGIMTICSLTGACIGFLISRYLLRDYFRSKLGIPPIEEKNEKMNENGYNGYNRIKRSNRYRQGFTPQRRLRKNKKNGSNSQSKEMNDRAHSTTNQQSTPQIKSSTPALGHLKPNDIKMAQFQLNEQHVTQHQHQVNFNEIEHQHKQHFIDVSPPDSDNEGLSLQLTSLQFDSTNDNDNINVNPNFNSTPTTHQQQQTTSKTPTLTSKTITPHRSSPQQHKDNNINNVKINETTPKKYIDSTKESSLLPIRPSPSTLHTTSTSTTTITTTPPKTDDETTNKPSFWAQIDEVIAEDGFTLVFLLRFSPLHPYGIFNYMFGVTSVSFWSYFFASLISMFPTTLMEVYMGSALKNVGEIIGVTKDNRPAITTPILGSDINNDDPTISLPPDDINILLPIHGGGGNNNNNDELINPDNIQNHIRNNQLPDDEHNLIKHERQNVIFWCGLIFTLLSAIFLTLYIKTKLKEKLHTLSQQKLEKEQRQQQYNKQQKSILAVLQHNNNNTTTNNKDGIIHHNNNKRNQHHHHHHTPRKRSGSSIISHQQQHKLQQQQQQHQSHEQQSLSTPNVNDQVTIDIPT